MEWTGSRLAALAALLVVAATPPWGGAGAAERVCAAGETVPGLDVSKWQGAINWVAVGQTDVTFVIARVSHGLYFDEYFEANWEGIRANGMIRGAYHFYEPLEDVVAQAELVVDAVGMLGPGDLPVTIDVEWTDGTPVLADLRTLIELVEAGTGKRPMIYTAASYWNQYFTTEFAAHDLWVANWEVDCPILPDTWGDWLFWQTTGGGRDVPGISGGVDSDEFNGTLAELRFVAGLPAGATCSGSRALACHREGCGCVDDVCSGGDCPGTGCTPAEEARCAAEGARCALGECLASDACAALAGALPGEVCWDGRRYRCDETGTPSPLPTPPEVCNGADDDCDGETDEGFGVGEPCTAGEGACVFEGVLACAEGGGPVVCSAAAPLCDDGDPCTNDGCDPATGCVTFPNSAPCDDGDPCTTDDVCRDGACAGGARTPGCCVADADCAAPAERCDAATGTCQAAPCPPGTRREGAVCVADVEPLDAVGGADVSGSDGGGPGDGGPVGADPGDGGSGCAAGAGASPVRSAAAPLALLALALAVLALGRAESRRGAVSGVSRSRRGARPQRSVPRCAGLPGGRKTLGHERGHEHEHEHGHGHGSPRS